MFRIPVSISVPIRVPGYILNLGAAVLTVLFSTGLHAAPEVVVTNAWIRATVPAQKSTGAFLTIESSETARLVAASTPVAQVTELHVTNSSDGIMRMRATPAVELPANQTVELAPGGTHVMLMGLKAQVADGQFVPMSLTIEAGDGSRTTVQLQVPVRPITTK
ncbi:MAG: copper chaperone PCu(A)C [Burkholderiaceae bacterium]